MAETAAFVKVCMDGAPYLRKVDLKMYKSYQELSDALAKMFSSFTMGKFLLHAIYFVMLINLYNSISLINQLICYMYVNYR